MLQIGQTAPDFSLPDQDGKFHCLSDYYGQWVLLYFYPQDDTPGCTTEACLLRDNLPRFEGVAAVVIGVSVDDVASHKKFAEKYRLPFRLLADDQKVVVNQYGVWGQKTFAGRNYEGTRRTSFLIDPKGHVAKLYENVKPNVHAQEVLRDLQTA